MPHEIRFDDDLERLWLLLPDQIPEDAVCRLRSSVASLRGSMLGVRADVIMGTYVDNMEAIQSLSSHIRSNVEALPDPVRRFSLSALILLPVAYNRSPEACRSLAALFDLAATAPSEQGIHAILGIEWRKQLTYLADAWRYHGLDQMPTAPFCESPAPESETQTAVSSGSDPTIEEIRASVARVLGDGDDCAPQPTASQDAERRLAANAIGTPSAPFDPNTYVRVILGTPPVAETPIAVDLRRYVALGRLMVKRPPSGTLALDGLDTVFPHFAEVTEGIRREVKLAADLGAAQIKLVPRLLIGPPGSGKSRYLSALAEALERPARFLSAGANDARSLLGTARGWSSAIPSFPMTVFAETLRADPIIVLDEIDKADVRDGRCPLQAGLLAMIEPSTAAKWHDECLMVPCDLSWIGWMFTANGQEGILPELLDRCRVHHIGPPPPAHFDAYVDTIRGDIALDLGIPVDALPTLDPVVRDAMRRAFRRKPALRELKRAVRQVMSIAPRPTRH